MAPYPTPLEIERATYLAWVVTGVGGLVAGGLLWPAFAFVARATRMRVLASLLLGVAGIIVFGAAQWVHYRIAEAPFEPPVWIDPGLTSKCLPLAAMIVGFGLSRAVSRQVAAR